MMSYSETEQNGGTGLTPKEQSYPPHEGQGPHYDHGEHRLKFSVQDQIFMRKLRTEAAITRGYPLALVSMGLTVFGIGRFFPKVQRWQKYLIAGSVGIIGNITGKASYIPTMIQRIKTDLPPESPLRQLVEARGKGESLRSLFESQQDRQKDQEIQFGLEEDSKQENKFVSYDELRRKNRQMEKPEWRGRFTKPNSSTDSNTDPYTNQNDMSPQSSYPAQQTEPDVQQSGKVRYNKYGDQIIE